VVLMLPGATLPFCQIVLVLAVVQEAADRWNSVGRNFHEVEISLAGRAQGGGKRHHTQTLPIVADDEHFVSANALVPANLSSYARSLALNRGVIMIPAPNYSECGAMASTCSS
jgi:hypothetical protein